MPPTRMNANIRAELKQFATKHVEAKVERELVDETYTAVAKLIRAAVDEKFPPKDMKVLERYGLAHRDPCINRGSYRDDQQFDFNIDDKRAPLLPRYGGCSDRTFEFAPDVQAKLSAWHLAKNAHEKAVETKRDDYTRLIDSARTFEEIAALWPAVEQFRARFCQSSQAIAALSAEAIARIKADNAGMSAAA